ncbi:unnamed protein product, partial [Allacma fusca]
IPIFPTSKNLVPISTSVPVFLFHGYNSKSYPKWSAFRALSSQPFSSFGTSGSNQSS